MQFRKLFVALSLFVIAGFLGFQLALTLPTRPPDLAATYTPVTQAAPSGLGAYDVMSRTVGQVEAAQLLPLGLVTHIEHARPKLGISCALCHATVNPASGKIMEGATNTDVNLGLLLAMAPNSAALFHQTDVTPIEIPADDHTYIDLCRTV